MIKLINPIMGIGLLVVALTFSSQALAWTHYQSPSLPSGGNQLKYIAFDNVLTPNECANSPNTALRAYALRDVSATSTNKRPVLYLHAGGWYGRIVMDSFFDGLHNTLHLLKQSGNPATNIPPQALMQGGDFIIGTLLREGHTVFVVEYPLLTYVGLSGLPSNPHPYSLAFNTSNCIHQTSREVLIGTGEVLKKTYAEANKAGNPYTVLQNNKMIIVGASAGAHLGMYLTIDPLTDPGSEYRDKIHKTVALAPVLSTGRIADSLFPQPNSSALYKSTNAGCIARGIPNDFQCYNFAESNGMVTNFLNSVDVYGIPGLKDTIKEATSFLNFTGATAIPLKEWSLATPHLKTNINMATVPGFYIMQGEADTLVPHDQVALFSSVLASSLGVAPAAPVPSVLPRYNRTYRYKIEYSAAKYVLDYYIWADHAGEGCTSTQGYPHLAGYPPLLDLHDQQECARRVRENVLDTVCFAMDRPSNCLTFN